MSVIGKYPGVFPEITDLSQITENASTSIIGAVGEARRGTLRQLLHTRTFMVHLI